MTRRPTAPIPPHLVDRFFDLAWMIAEGGFPQQQWHQLGKKRRTSAARRNALASLWGVSAALRFSELQGLLLSDVSPAGLTAWIRRSKRGIDGLVQVSPQLIQLTEAWRSTSGVADSPWLFPSRTGRPLNNNVLNESIGNLFGTLLGIEITTHSYRDTACHLAVSQGASVYEVQRFMGHRSAITTEEYLRKVKAQSVRLHAVDRSYVGRCASDRSHVDVETLTS